MQDDNKMFEFDEQLSNLLGDKVRLYNKILYLVIADAVYCEGKVFSINYCSSFGISYVSFDILGLGLSVVIIFP